MRLIPVLFILLLYTFWGCSTTKKFQELQTNCCKNISNSFEEGRSIAGSLDKTILTVVLTNTEQNFLTDNTCQVFGLTEKKDKAYLKIIERDFIIVKLSPSQFKQEIADTLFHYQYAKEFVDDALASEKSFIFISNPQNPSVYGPTHLHVKEQVKDLIWVQFGP